MENKIWFMVKVRVSWKVSILFMKKEMLNRRILAVLKTEIIAGDGSRKISQLSALFTLVDPSGYGTSCYYANLSSRPIVHGSCLG